MSIKSLFECEQLNEEEEFYDYHTAPVRGKDIFDVNVGESPYAKDMIRLAKTGGVTKEGRSARIVQMSPNEYFEAVARGFGSSKESQLRQIRSDDKVLDHLMRVITEYKRKFPITYIAADEGEEEDTYFQEGRHRMYVAGELFGWDTKFPVLQIYIKDKDKYNKAKQEEKDEVIYRAIDRAVRYAYSNYTYSNIEEIKDELDWQLASQLEDVLEYKKITYKVDEDVISIIIDGKLWDKAYLSDFDIDENKETADIDDTDLDDLDDEEIEKLEKELGLKFNESVEETGRTVIKALIYHYEDTPKKVIPEFRDFEEDGVYSLGNNNFIAFEKRYAGSPLGWGLIHQDIEDNLIEPLYHNYHSPYEMQGLEIDNLNPVNQANLFYDIDRLQGMFEKYRPILRKAVYKYFRE